MIFDITIDEEMKHFDREVRKCLHGMLENKIDCFCAIQLIKRNLKRSVAWQLSYCVFHMLVAKASYIIGIVATIKIDAQSSAQRCKFPEHDRIPNGPRRQQHERRYEYEYRFFAMAPNNERKSI